MYGRHHRLNGQTAGPLAPIPLTDTPKEGADLFGEVADLSVGIDRREPPVPTVVAVVAVGPEFA